ncbi:MAG: peptidoglycan recognition family protein [Candidatus Fermentibacteria bacterium]
MQSCADWLRSHFSDIPDISDEELNSAGEKPSEDLYERLDRINSLVIHHSATATGNARVFRALHRAANGWIDIGYHFVIGNGTLSLDGEIEPGRPLWAVGAHAREHNSDTIGICLVGDFTKTSPTLKQLASLKDLLKKLLEDFTLSRSDILLHRDVPGCRTECPGDNLTLKEVIDSLS